MSVCWGERTFTYINLSKEFFDAFDGSRSNDEMSALYLFALETTKEASHIVPSFSLNREEIYSEKQRAELSYPFKFLVEHFCIALVMPMNPRVCKTYRCQLMWS